MKRKLLIPLYLFLSVLSCFSTAIEVGYHSFRQGFKDDLEKLKNH